MPELEQVTEAAERSARNPGQVLMERLVERIGGVANAAAVFGAPIQQGETTVVPVARVRWGAGGGGGVGGPGGEQGAGSGGGGGASATAAGYIEIGPGGARFVRTRDITDLWPVVLASGVAGWLLLRGLRSLLRR